MKKNVLIISLFISFCAVYASDLEMKPPAPAPDAAFFGSRIQRTMTLLKCSSEEIRFPVKILFYGQSITASKWWKLVKEDLEKRFPHADLIIENRSIGGHTAPTLVKEAEHDLYDFYPDLVIFHVYGGEKSGDLERIYSNIRRYTTAEIVTYTHHVAHLLNKKKEPNSYHEQTVADDWSAEYLRYLAQKYNCELVEVREEWMQYLKHNKLKPMDLLCDGIHLNEKGLWLMAKLVGRHFKFNPRFPNNWMDMVRTYEARRFLESDATDEITYTGEPWPLSGWDAVVGSSPDSALTLTFDGNRADIIPGDSRGYQLGTARILIDGKTPSQLNLFTITQCSKALGVWFPALRQVKAVKPLLDEEWTLRITKISDDHRDVEFEVTGSKTGADGRGSSLEKFVSNSGRVVIGPKEWKLAWAKSISKKPVPIGWEIKWATKPLCVDTYKAPKNKNSKIEQLVTILQGLSNTKHTLQIIPNGDGRVPIKGIQTYRPPLR